VRTCGWLKRERGNRYGSVEGLPDDELADPDESEPMAYVEEYGPILRLPLSERRHLFYGTIDEDGRVDFGAFGTVDFDRHRGEFDGSIVLCRSDLGASRSGPGCVAGRGQSVLALRPGMALPRDRRGRLNDSSGHLAVFELFCHFS